MEGMHNAKSGLAALFAAWHIAKKHAVAEFRMPRRVLVFRASHVLKNRINTDAATTPDAAAGAPPPTQA